MLMRDSPGRMTPIEQGCFEEYVLHSRPTVAAHWTWCRYAAVAVPGRSVTGVTRGNRTLRERFGSTCQTPSHAGNRAVVAYRGYPVRAWRTIRLRGGPAQFRQQRTSLGYV